MVAYCGVCTILLGLVALAGGAFAMARRNWSLAMLGGICGLIAFWTIVGSVLAAAGLVLLWTSRYEFF